MKKIIGIILIFVVVIFVLLLLYYFNFIPHRMYNNEDFHIQTYISQIYQDQDGIDDQTDILQSAISYINTNPKYQSKYYATGYPNDHYGVCTDVVAFALKGAGYDLMELVNEDVLLHRDDYNIDVVDQNIDFRRVENLEVYFRKHAISLTTDVYDIGAWQGGDIVIFKNHIGIVSNHRNRHGVSFIIHHASSWQRSYEEDILEYRMDIIGHYRMS